MTTELERSVELLTGADRIVVLTGAGMSRESGLPTFRDALTGLWSRFDAAELATEAAFRRDPARVFGWYLHRVRQVQVAEPHAGHIAIAELARLIGRVDVVTQNVDGLHRRAGSDGVIELHGSLEAFRCLENGHPYDVADLGAIDVPPDGRVVPPCCAQCGSPIRPGVVWFGEPLPAPAFDAARRAIATCEAMLVVGTSAVVFPAAELLYAALRRSIPVIEVNPRVTPVSARVRVSWRVTAGVALPALAARLAGVRSGT